MRDGWKTGISNRRILTLADNDARARRYGPADLVLDDQTRLFKSIMTFLDTSRRRNYRASGEYGARLQTRMRRPCAHWREEFALLLTEIFATGPSRTTIAQCGAANSLVAPASIRNVTWRGPFSRMNDISDLMKAADRPLRGYTTGRNGCLLNISRAAADIAPCPTLRSKRRVSGSSGMNKRAQQRDLDLRLSPHYPPVDPPRSAIYVLRHRVFCMRQRMFAN